MIRARPPRVDHADVDSGMRFHWRTDEVFHRSARLPTADPSGGGVAIGAGRPERQRARQWRTSASSLLLDAALSGDRAGAAGVPGGAGGRRRRRARSALDLGIRRRAGAVRPSPYAPAGSRRHRRRHHRGDRGRASPASAGRPSAARPGRRRRARRARLGVRRAPGRLGLRRPADARARRPASLSPRLQAGASVRWRARAFPPPRASPPIPLTSDSVAFGT